MTENTPQNDLTIVTETVSSFRAFLQTFLLRNGSIKAAPLGYCVTQAVIDLGELHSELLKEMGLPSEGKTTITTTQNSVLPEQTARIIPLVAQLDLQSHSGLLDLCGVSFTLRIAFEKMLSRSGLGEVGRSLCVPEVIDALNTLNQKAQKRSEIIGGGCHD